MVAPVERNRGYIVFRYVRKISNGNAQLQAHQYQAMNYGMPDHGST
jgi:galactose mutarotase-like enzyme